jgi:nucleoside-diphosphate-sugar epimerase
MNEKTNILLTGASGAIGYEVLEQLCAAPGRYVVTVVARRSKRSKSLFKPYADKIEIVYGDITDEILMEKICSNKDVVIHLAALIPPMADEEPEMAYKVNTLGTQYLVEGLMKYSPKAFILFSSSIAVYGDRLKDPFIRVGDPLVHSKGDIYAQTKIEAESIIRSADIDWCILRLTAIMGKHKMSKLMFHMPLETRMEIATIKDTARAFVNAVDKKEMLSKKIFNLGGGEKMRLTYQELLSRSFAIFGLGPVDFPKYSFAEKNFHCGYYMDGDELEKILHFREDSLETYFDHLRRSFSPFKRFMASLLKKMIKRRLLKQSEPLQAVVKKDATLIDHFF